MIQDLNLAKPPLQTDARYVGLSTDTKPSLATDGSIIDVGSEYQETDTGVWYYWDGAAWQQTTFMQKFNQLVEVAVEIRDLLREQNEN